VRFLDTSYKEIDGLPWNHSIKVTCTSTDLLPFNMATPHFEPLKDNKQILAAIDVCMRSDSDKSEQRIELLPGGKYSCRLRRVLAFLSVTSNVTLPGLLVVDPGNCLRGGG